MKFFSEFASDVKKGENIEVYLTITVCVVVTILDLLGVVDIDIVTSAILFTLGLLAFNNLTTRKTVENLEASLNRLGGAGIEVLDSKYAFPQHIALRAKQAKKFILDTNLNQEIRRSSTGSPQIEYRKIRDERILKREIAFRRVEVIFHREHLESVIHRLLLFEGYDFFLRHYDAPPQAIPILHLMSFDNEHFYIGGFYPSDPSTEEKAVYIHSSEMAELMHEYWQMLWLRGIPLNEGRVINWPELKRIGFRLGLSEDQFESLVEHLKDRVEQERTLASR